MRILPMNSGRKLYGFDDVLKKHLSNPKAAKKSVMFKKLKVKRPGLLVGNEKNDLEKQKRLPLKSMASRNLPLL